MMITQKIAYIVPGIIYNFNKDENENSSESYFFIHSKTMNWQNAKNQFKWLQGLNIICTQSYSCNNKENVSKFAFLIFPITMGVCTMVDGS